MRQNAAPFYVRGQSRDRASQAKSAKLSGINAPGNRINDIKYRLSSWNDITDYAERKNKITGGKEVILVRKKQNKISLRMDYQFSDGYLMWIHFWKEGAKYGELDHVFKNHEQIWEYLEKKGKDIRNFWM